jgi:hypothetical protein
LFTHLSPTATLTGTPPELEPALALLARLAGQEVCVGVNCDRLLPISLAPVPDPVVPPEVLHAVRQRKADLLAFLRADGHPMPRLHSVQPAAVGEVAAALRRAVRVGLEIAVTGSPNPYRARPFRLVMATDAHNAFVLDVRMTNVLPLRDALANVELLGWGFECTRLGLMALLLVTSDRPITGVVPGAGLVVGDDDEAIAIAARRAAYAAAAGH